MSELVLKGKPIFHPDGDIRMPNSGGRMAVKTMQSLALCLAKHGYCYEIGHTYGAKKGSGSLTLILIEGSRKRVSTLEELVVILERCEFTLTILKE